MPHCCSEQTPAALAKMALAICYLATVKPSGENASPLPAPALSSLARATWPLLVHLRLHYQLIFLSPLFAWGFALGGGELTVRAGWGFLAFHVFLYGGITAYNSYYDRDEGPVGGLLKPPSVTEPLLAFSLAVQLVGLGLALLVSWELVALYATVMVLSVAYSHPRFRWK